MATRRAWTREELILAMNLYLRLPFGRMHRGAPEVIELAGIIGRTPSAVAMRLGNFAALDESLDRRGMPNVGADARAIWREFEADRETLAFEGERLLHERRQPSLLDEVALDGVAGIDRDALVRVRVNQAQFRRMILARFDSTCAVTGLRIPELLVASHIIPWAESVEHRLDPGNGLCLNALHDRAFERGLIVIDDDLRIRASDRLRRGDTSEPVRDLLLRYDGAPLRLGDSRPSAALLARHRARFAA